MAAAQIIVEPPKSTPDISKLNGMTGRIVQVTRHTSKTGPGQLIVAATKGMTVEQIVNLQTSLMTAHGPGTYRFEVAEEGGSERDVWTVRLGSETQTEVPMQNAQNSNGFPTVPTQLAPGLIDLGHGYVYNETTGTLTTPRKNIYVWSPGQPLPLENGPVPVPAPSAPATPLFSSGLPPWAAMQQQDAASERVRVLEDQLKAQETARRETEIRAAFDRATEETRRANEATNKRLEELVAKLGERPAGPSPEVEALKAQLAEQNRRLEETQRAAETRAREDALRAEMRQQQENTERVLRELKDSRSAGPDPTMALIAQLFTASQQTMASTVKSLEESTRSQVDTARSSANMIADRMAGSMLTPERLLEVMRTVQTTTQGVNGELNKGAMEVVSSLFNMQQSMMQQMAQANPDAPPWIGAVQQGIEQIGTLAKVLLMNRTAPPPRPPAQPQQQVRKVQAPPAPQVLAPAPVTPPPAPSVPAASASAPPPPAAAPAKKRGKAAAATTNGAAPGSPAAQRDAIAAQVFPPAAASTVQRDAVATVMFPRPEEFASAAPVGVPVQQPSTPIVPDAVLPGQLSPEDVAAAHALVAQLAEKSSDEVSALLADVDDEEFFGAFYEHVMQLRASDLQPTEVASMVMIALQRGAGIVPKPVVIDLVEVGHAAVVVNRLLPERDADYCEAVTEALTEQLQGAAA